MNKPDLHVVSFSGGKDSTAMLLRMLEEGWPVDIVLFCDTGLEYPAMYEHIKKVEKNTGREITRLKADQDFEYLFAEVPISRPRNEVFNQKYGPIQNGYGWAGPRMRWCTEKLKGQPRERFLKPLKEKYHIIEYVGLAADEGYRMSRKCNQRADVRHPLIEWGMTEADCLKYCTDRGYDWGGLYDLFKRVSCWCCPLQSLAELRKLYKNFPALWEQLKKWDSITWRDFRADYSVIELERRFDFEEEWLKAGNTSLRSKAFFTALNQRLKELADADSDH